VAVNQTFVIEDLIDKESVFVFGWYPEPRIGFGALSQINIELEPYQSRLFYFSERDEMPPEDLTLGGKVSGGL
jgi:hypothetical protein